MRGIRIAARGSGTGNGTFEAANAPHGGEDGELLRCKRSGAGSGQGHCCRADAYSFAPLCQAGFLEMAEF